MKRYKNRAQTTVELALAMIGVVILFLGCINTFVWLNRVMAARQKLYDESRAKAASVPSSKTPDERQVNESWLPKLNTLE
jgi:ATP/ADP translocase